MNIGKFLPLMQLLRATIQLLAITQKVLAYDSPNPVLTTSDNTNTIEPVLKVTKPARTAVHGILLDMHIPMIAKYALYLFIFVEIISCLGVITMKYEFFTGDLLMGRMIRDNLRNSPVWKLPREIISILYLFVIKIIFDVFLIIFLFIETIYNFC